MMIGVLRSYIDDFLSTESTEDSIPALNAVSQVLEDAEVQFLSLPRHNLDSSRAPSRSEAMCGHLSAVLWDYSEILEKASGLLVSRLPLQKIAALRFYLAVSRCSEQKLEDVIPNWGDTVDSIKSMSSDDNYVLAAYSGLLLSRSHSYSFIADSISQTSFPKIVASRVHEAHKHLCVNESRVMSKKVQLKSRRDIYPLKGEEDFVEWCSCPDDVTTPIDYWLLIALGSMQGLCLVGEYIEALNPCLEFDTCRSALDFCKLAPSCNALAVVSIEFLANSMAHRKLAIDFIDNGGYSVLLYLYNTRQSKLYWTSIAFALFSIACHSVAVEKLMTHYRYDEAPSSSSFGGRSRSSSMDSMTDDTFSSLKLMAIVKSFLKSQNSSTLRNTFLFLGEAFSFPQLLYAFDAVQGLQIIVDLYRRTNSVRLSNNMELIHDDDEQEDVDAEIRVTTVNREILRVLTQYFRVHLYVYLSGGRDSNSDSEFRVIRPSESQYFGLLKVIYDSIQNTGQPPVQLVKSEGKCWQPACHFIDCGGLTLFLHLIAYGNNEMGSSTMCQVLSLLCFNASIIHDIVTAEIKISGGETKPALTYIIEIAGGNVYRDPISIMEALRLLAALCAPPVYHLQLLEAEEKGNLMGPSWEHWSMLAMHPQAHSSTTQGRGRKRFFEAQTEARIVIRKVSGLRLVMQALQYRRRIDQIDMIRYHAALLLIGLAQDKEINDILAKMGLSQTVSFLLQCSEEQQIRIRSSSSRVQDKNYLLFRTFARQLISLLAPGRSVLMADATISGITQLNIDKELIVCSSKIAFDPKQLLMLIRDHLMVEGYMGAAELLSKDASLGDTLIARGTENNSEKYCRLSIKTSTSDELLNRIREAKKSQVDPPVVSPIKADHHQTSMQVNAVGSKRAADQMQHSDTLNNHSACKKANSSSGHKEQISSSIKQSFTPLTSKKVTQFSSPSYFSPATETHNSVVKSKLVSPGPKLLKAVRQEENKSALGKLVDNYLRFQHQQCTHPISTLPVFSLTSPHCCPTPISPQVDFCSILNSREISRGFSIGRGLNGPLSGLKHLVYSRYRSWRVLQDDMLTTAISFCSQDPSRIWVAYGWHDDNISGELRLYDVKTCHQYSSWTNLPEIERIVVPHSCEKPIVILQLITEQISFDNPYKKYDNNIYRPDNFTLPLATAPSMSQIALSGADNALVGYKTPVGDIDPSKLIVTLHDIETSMDIISFDSGEAYQNPNIAFGLGDLGDFIVAANGGLFDLRVGSLIHQFDRISLTGYSSFHPNGQSLLVDNALWDLRTYGLVCAASVGENAVSNFSSFGDVLFSYTPYRENDFDQGKRRLPENSTIRVLDTLDYKEIYSWSNEKPGICNWYVQTDFADDGYLGVLEFQGDATSGGINQSWCNILEIGRRKLDDGDSDNDDAQSGHDDDEDDDDDDDDANDFDDEDLSDDDVDDVQAILDEEEWHNMAEVDDEIDDYDEEYLDDGGDDDDDDEEEEEEEEDDGEDDEDDSNGEYDEDGNLVFRWI